jgi:3-oxoacyl-[acyl-carrier protein] reductase
MPPRRVLITGSSRGIGRSLVDHYLDLGDIVVGCSRTRPSIEHERFSHYELDVTDSEAVRDVFRDVSRRVGGLDAVINNAGVASMNALALTPAATARKVMDTNFLGTFVLSQAAVRLLRASPCPRIVNVTSIAVPLRLHGEAVYAASKSAVETLTRIAARELAPFRITCNAVGPSPIRTALTAGVPEHTMQALVDSQPIPRWAEAADVANVIDFFLSPQSALVTGQVLYLGGWS